MTDCPCGSGRILDECCGPILSGAPAPGAEALMRSRYSAYVLGNIDHVERTNAPEIRGDFNRAEAERIAGEAEWQGLEVKTASEAEDGTGTVEFRIRFRRDGQDLVHHERASFRREDGQWLYVDGDVNPKPVQRIVEKIGRNDPCPCGSGKKYKKCCGA